MALSEFRRDYLLVNFFMSSTDYRQVDEFQAITLFDLVNSVGGAIGLFTGDPNATLALFASNMLWVGLGNLIGGGVIVGLGYWIVGGSPRIRAAAPRDGVRETVPAAG